MYSSSTIVRNLLVSNTSSFQSLVNLDMLPTMASESEGESEVDGRRVVECQKPECGVRKAYDEVCVCQRCSSYFNQFYL